MLTLSSWPVLKVLPANVMGNFTADMSTGLSGPLKPGQMLSSAEPLTLSPSRNAKVL